MARQAPELFAVIHVGSEQITAQVVEYQSLSDIKILERTSRQVLLGEEMFKTGRLSFDSVNEVCELLKGCRRLLQSYGVRDYRVIATTAIREAQNQQYIIDQIKVKTGFTIEVVDMPREIFLKYVTLFKTIQAQQLVIEQKGVLFVDISSGGLGITLYKDGRLIYQQNIHIGVLRIKESFDKDQRESAHFHRSLAEFIFSTIEPVQRELKKHEIQYLVLSGVETRLMLKVLGKEGDKLTFVSLPEFMTLYEQLKALNLPQLMKLYQLSEQKAEMVLPTIVLVKQILSLIDVQEIAVPDDHFVDGVAIWHIAENTRDQSVQVLENQIISLAHAIGEKYQYDARHAAEVEYAAMLLFDRLVKVHGLSKRERLLLKVACILHDIGKFVSLRRHYFYSYRLIVSSDILGFSEEDKAIMANIALYHYKGTPSINDPNFAVLDKVQRVTVAKLAAIIRLADAIDRSHQQKPIAIEVQLRGDELVVIVNTDRDMSLEEWTFEEKADFFKEVFGIRPVLEIRVG